MTIQRKYSLPNCTLLLEGLSDGTTGMQSTDLRPLLSILVNAECHFSNSNQPLTGGRDFLENLAIAVSAYAQEFLSKVHHPEHQHSSRPVQFQKIAHNRHRLIVQSEHGDAVNASDPHQVIKDNNTVNAPTVIDLTTVQLFDLVEAIDQLFTDSKTLPDLSLKLTPVSKRYSGASQPLVKQAVPAALGVSSLAIAAIAFFLVPIPQPQEPKPQSSSSQSTSVNSTPTATAEITNSAQINALQQQLYNQLDQTWKTRSNVDQDLTYRVVVAADGKLVGYKSVSATANDYIKQTPLPELLSNPAANRVATQQAIAQFKVVFTDQGVLQVSPWNND